MLPRARGTSLMLAPSAVRSSWRRLVFNLLFICTNIYVRVCVYPGFRLPSLLTVSGQMNKEAK